MSYQGEVQMRSLSKIYRGGARDLIQKMEFRDLEDLEESENGMFIPSSGFSGDPESKERDSNGEREGAHSSSSGEEEQDSGLSQQEVEAIREEAHNRGRQEGVEEGYTRGKQDGRQEVEQEFDQAVQALGEAVEQINGLRRSILDSSKQDMVRLVRTIAEKVIHVEVRSREKPILRAVEKAIHAAVQSEEYRVRVNPEDMSLVTENKPLFLASISGLQNIVIESDEEISRGGCVVESDQGKVDGTIETQLEKIQEQLDARIASEDTSWSN